MTQNTFNPDTLTFKTPDFFKWCINESLLAFDSKFAKSFKEEILDLIHDLEIWDEAITHSPEEFYQQNQFATVETWSAIALHFPELMPEDSKEDEYKLLEDEKIILTLNDEDLDI